MIRVVYGLNRCVVKIQSLQVIRTLTSCTHHNRNTKVWLPGTKKGTGTPMTHLHTPPTSPPGSPPQASDLHLYWGSGSAVCWRVMLTLHEKGIKEYPNTLCSFEEGDHKSEQVRKLNPRAQIPTLKYKDMAINESLAAIDFLEHLFPDPPLHPKDTEKLSLVLQRKYEAINLHLRGMRFLMFFKHAITEDGKAELKKREEQLREEVNMWESILGQTTYVAGPEFSMADVVFFPHLAFCVRVGLQLTSDRYPNLKAYYDLMVQRSSVQDTWPPHWQDKPPSVHVMNVI